MLHTFTTQTTPPWRPMSTLASNDSLGKGRFRLGIAMNHRENPRVGGVRDAVWELQRRVMEPKVVSKRYQIKYPPWNLTYRNPNKNAICWREKIFFQGPYHCWGIPMEWDAWKWSQRFSKQKNTQKKNTADVIFQKTTAPCTVKGFFFIQACSILPSSHPCFVPKRPWGCVCMMSRMMP